MWKVQVGYKIGSNELDLEPDMSENYVRFSDSFYPVRYYFRENAISGAAIIPNGIIDFPLQLNH